MRLNNPNHATETLLALGLDPFLASYHFDGDKLEIEGVSDAEIEAAEAGLNIALLDKEERNYKADHMRREGYSNIGDQMDIIWKQFKALQASGTVTLLPETVAELMKIDKNKQDHPKEK